MDLTEKFYRGFEPVNVDENGIHLPSEFDSIFHRRNPVDHKGYVVPLIDQEERCLMYFDANSLEYMAQRSGIDKDWREMKRLVGTKGKPFEVKEGVIGLDNELTKLVGIKDEALIIGALNHLELWNPDQYEKFKIFEREYYKTL